MGLAERRATKEFQDKHFPSLRDELYKAAGFAVPLEINWEQLAVEGRSDRYKEAWTAIFFRPVIDALRQMGRDDMGKQALKAGLKKIELRNAAGHYSPHNAISFVNGVLAIDHELSNESDVEARKTRIIEIVEKEL